MVGGLRCIIGSEFVLCSGFVMILLSDQVEMVSL